MLASSIPTKFQLPFGKNAAAPNIRVVPVTTSDPDAASESLGFPPSTLTPLAAGGVPPDGRDFNGLFNQITAWLQWNQAGAPVNYDATFQSQIGGYPAGALVGSAITLGAFWLCLSNNNTTNPDSGGAGWIAFPLNFYASDSGTQNAIRAVLNPAPASMAALTGISIRINVANQNTIAAPTLQINSFTPVTIVNPGNVGLAVPQLVADGVADFVFDGTYAQLLSPGPSQAPPSSFVTGDAFFTFNPTAPTGWIVINDGTIGNATSGATTRANADTSNLFTLIWNNTTNTNCPVSGGRGANAAADFSASKTLQIPLALGRALASPGAGSGLTSRAMGQTAGAETVTLTNAQVPPTTVSLSGNTVIPTDPGTWWTLGEPAVGYSLAPASGAVSGGGGSHPNIQPTTFFGWVKVKL